MKTAIFLIFSNKDLSDESPTKSLLNVRPCLCYTVYAARRMIFEHDMKLVLKWQKIGIVLPMTRKNRSFIISMPKIMKFFLELKCWLNIS